MKKTVFLFLYLALATAVMTVTVVTAVGNHSKWPQTCNEYESLVEKALRPDVSVKEAYGVSSLLFQHDMISADGEAIVRMPGDFLISFHQSADFDMDRAIERIGALNEYCAQLNIPLLYVSFPSKATYTDANPEDYGICGIDKELRAAFLQSIRALGIPLLDMEKTFRDMGLSQEAVFYKTDHHWRTEMGLIAAKETADFLRSQAAVDMDSGLLEPSRFRATVCERKWLGETGRKVSASWAGSLDDYTLYEPDFETSFAYYVPSAKISTEGAFSDFINWDLLRGETNLYQDTLHYAYMKDAKEVTHFRNRNLSGANILLIKDSYSVPMAPFLAISCGDLTWWDMRKNKNDLFPYIDKHRFDAVVIAYTDFWRDEMYDFK